MKRTLAVAVIVCTQIHYFPPLLAQQPAPAGITITSMDRRSVMVFDRLVITGSGFDPARAAISVLFVPKQHGAPVVIPVHSATASRVEVIVPAFIDPTNGDFGFGAADVQVIQVTQDQVISSNVLAGLDVAPVASLPASAGTGRVTRAFVRLSGQLISTADGVSNPAARAAFAAFKQEQAALLTHIEGVVANPSSTAGAAALDSAPFVIDAAMLRSSDRLITAYLASMVPTLSSERSTGRGALTPQAIGDCDPDIEPGSIAEKLFCDYRDLVIGENRRLITGVASVAAAAGTYAALAIGGTALMVYGGAAAAVIGTTVLATQILFMGVSATLVPAFMAPDAPPILSGQFRALFDDVSARGRVVIAKVTGTGADAFAQVSALERSTPGSSPQGGTIAGAPALTAVEPVRQMLYVKAGRDPVVTTVGVPSTPAILSFAAAMVPATTAASFNGSYSGVMTVGSTDRVQGGDYAFNFTVAGGTGTVTEYVRGSGPVFASGRVLFDTLSPGGFACTITGGLAMYPSGAASGGGGVNCSNGQDKVTGVWSAERRPAR